MPRLVSLVVGRSGVATIVRTEKAMSHLVRDFIQLLASLAFLHLWKLTSHSVLAAVTPTTPDPNKHDVKMDLTTKPRPPDDKPYAASSLTSGSGAATPLSMAAESAITFISVFVVGCVITLSVYSWKKFKPSEWR